ncbi:MAG TPA: glycosyltransferase [Bacilli bacterium]|nr:glycosyltransferase [Bacilli bacterium]
MAPHIFQTNLLSGFESLNDVSVEVINIPPTGSFPINNKRLYSKGYYWGENNYQIGYLNLPRIKWSVHKKKLLKELDNRLAVVKDMRDVSIIAYSVYEPFLDVFIDIKAKYPEVQLCLIQTDPIMGRGERDRYMTPAAVEEGNRIVAKAKVVDKFVLLTKFLADAIEVGTRPFSVVECVCNPNQPQSKEGLHRNICLYTGTLNEEFGIKELVDAFNYIKNGELWICGEGDTKEYILEREKIQPNIKYLGYLTREEIRKCQDECDFLINPRRPSGTYTMYSFPSKTAEYMMTGKPVIMYKLEGIPDEYDEYLNYLYEKQPFGIAHELEYFFNDLNYDELVRKAWKGRTFMQNSKSCNEQAEKIIELLKNA